jgi:transcriptional regulator with XRE-family HTH domain
MNYKEFSSVVAETRAEAIKRLKARCKAETQKKVAADLKVSQSYLSDVIHDRRDMTEKLLKKLLA